MQLQPTLKEANVSGPFFVSIGDETKLAKFLEINPDIPTENMFVDGYNFTAYNTLRLKKITDLSKEDTRGVTLVAPRLGGFQGWWKYFTNVASLSPVVPGQTGIPEGVLRLGATFVVSKDRIVYQWNDRVPGDQPDLSQVVLAAREAAEENAKSKKQPFFGLTF